MSAEKEIKTIIQNSTLNSTLDPLSKWDDPHINDRQDNNKDNNNNF